MIKKNFCLFLIFFCLSFLEAQSSIRLGVLKGISCLPCAYLIENKEKLSVQNMTFKIYDSPQKELPALLKGEIDAGFLAPEDAAKVFEKAEGALLCCAVVQNGNLYLLTGDPSYSSIYDLRGKTILCDEKDSSPSIFRHILSKMNIPFDAKENPIQLVFSVPLANMANNIITKKSDYALLSEPYASIALKNSKQIRRSENFLRIYSEKEEGSSYPAMILVVAADFARKNRGIVRKFRDLYKTSIQWTNKNPAKAGLLSEKHGLGLSADLVRRSLPQASIVWRDASVAKSDIEKYLRILGRNLPEESFYF